jgi:regulation of enolase protein 1 (concanavalin A-like superfamily)
MTRVPILKLLLLGTLLLSAAHQGQGQTGNILTNPGFESGTTGWTFYTDASATFSSVTPGFEGSKTGRVSITTPGTNVQLAQVNFPLDPNTDYRLTFAAYSNTGHDLSVSVLQNVSPYTNYGLSSSLANLTTGWQTFTVNFRTSGFSVPVSDARLRFWLAPYDATGDFYYIDNVILQKTGTPPSIASQPSGTAVLAGQTAAFSITATGSDTLTYQWQRNTVDIAGANSASYTTPVTVLGDNGASYRCVVRNAFGTATSNGATLTVLDPLAPPTITQQPAAQNVTTGQTATFTVGASGVGTLTYQWQKNTVNIAGALAASYTTPPTSLADSGSIFRCIVSNANGPTTSNGAFLRVDSIRVTPPSITQQPSNQTVLSGQTATFFVVATGSGPLSYQWQKNNINIAGATLSSYTTPATGTGDNGSGYRCVVTNPAGPTASNSALLTVLPASSAMLRSPQPGEIYKEYTRTIVATGNVWRVTDPNTIDPNAQLSLPNAILSLTISDTVGAVRAEAILDMWGGHIGTTGKKFRVNGRNWLPIPELGADNGIPAGSFGQCYMNQWNPTVAIPLNQLKQGTNTFEGTNTGQTCYNFNWGLWGWYGIIVRVYYGPSKAHPTGSITSPTAGGTINDNPLITATASGSAGINRVEFFASYQGFDPDGDGIYGGYQHSYHRLKADTQMETKFHLGTVTSAPYQVTWNTQLVPDQIAGSVRILARIRDNNGVWFVTNEASGLTLRRDSVSVKMYTAQNVPERMSARLGQTKSANYIIPPDDSLGKATAATLIVRTWNGNNYPEDPGVTHSLKVNTYTVPTASYGIANFFILNSIGIPTSSLLQGVNTVSFYSNNIHHGIDVKWPGPTLLVRYRSSPGVPPTITLQPVNQSANEGQSVSFTVAATGSAPLTYQWFKNGAMIAGATLGTLTFPSVSVADNGAAIRCDVANTVGRVSSDNASLSVVAIPPTIVRHPASMTVAVGRAVTFNMFASGSDPLAFQWQKNGVNIPGATAIWYTTPATGSADSGAIFRCVVTNNGGSVFTNDALLQVTSTTPPSSLVSDDFNTTVLNPSLWQFINPGAPSTLQMTGAGTSDARVRVQLPASTHDMWSTGAGAPRFLQPANNTDFDVELKFESSLTAQYQMQGLIVEQDSMDYIRFDVVRRTSDSRIYAASGVNNVFTQRYNVVVPNAAIWYIRIRRVGNQWTQWYSTNGTSWTQAGTFSHSLSVGRVGPWFGNSGSPAPALTGLIDYFFNNSSRISPEDGATIPPGITLQPLSQSVYQGSSVTFTVAAGGTPPLAYQWQRNDVDIAGATSPSYSISRVLLADSGSQFRCRVTNAYGSATSNRALLSVTRHPSGIASDDFNAFGINASLWDVINPLGDAFFYMTGTNTQDARVSVDLPAGTVHDAWSGPNTTVRLMQPANNTDFEVEAKFDGPLDNAYQTQGIMVQQDAFSFLRFEFLREPSNLTIFAASIIAGAPTERYHVNIPNVFPLWLRVRRQGNSWLQSYSTNGTAWTSAATYTQSLVVTSVGPFFGNAGAPTPSFTSQLDYFFLTADPIVPEDGGTAIDTVPPVLAKIKTTPYSAGFGISWITNEPATGLVEYGLTTSYELGFVEHSDLRTSHALTVTALQPSTTYHYRVTSVDAVGNVTTSADSIVATVTPTPPVLSFWYGKNQTFGLLGNPQPYINVLGNVSDGNGVMSISYSLNGGPDQNLSMGPDTRRLNRKGDFNIDILSSALNAGLNQVFVTAIDSQLTVTRDTVNVTYVAGNTWAGAYSVDWSSASSIPGVVQVVDGKWAIVNNSLRTTETGYDRLIAIGEKTWVDYEVTTSFTVHSLDSSGFVAPSNGSAVGFLMRWPGHSDKPASAAGFQPKAGFLPLGGFAIYGWEMTGLTRMSISGDNLALIAENTQKTLQFNIRYNAKARVETIPGSGTRYSMKFWQDGTSEPAAWDVSGNEPTPGPQQGCLLLVAHEADVSIGNISVVPLQEPSTMVSDDFYGGTINSSLWTFVNPRDDAAISVTGGGTTNARLTLNVPGGINHEPWSPANTAPRILQPVNNTSFEAQLKFESVFTGQVQMHGFLAEQDTNNFIRFDFSSSGTATKIFSGTNRNGVYTTRYNQNIASGLPPYMRVKRTGDLWTISYSYNDSVWTQAGSFAYSMIVNRVGPFAGNSGAIPPSYTGLVDYVFNTSLPLVPEDGGASGLAARILNEPPGRTAAEGDSTTFTVLATGTPPLFYRWQRNGVDVPGATAASYVRGPLTVAGDNGTQFRCIVNNAQGADTSLTAQLTVSYPPSIIISDDYRTGTLNTSLWRFVNPLNDASLAFTGAGTQNARLAINVPGGTAHDLWTSGNFAPRIMQDANNTNFEVEAKFESGVSSVHQIQGMLVQQNSANFIRFDFVTHATSNYTRVFCASILGGTATTRINLNTVAKGVQPMWLRVKRQADLWTVSYSQNGTTFTTAGTFTLPFTVDSVGVYAGNAGSPVPAFTSLVDYFFNNDLPLSPEDPLPPNIVTQPVHRSVSVGQRGIFTVIAGGTPPLSYQWQKNGVDITGGTGVTYYTQPAILSDSGATFRCVVSNSFGSTPTNIVRLDVHPAVPLPWWNGRWHFRIPVRVMANSHQRMDKPVEASLDFTSALLDLGAGGGALDLNSIRVIEIDTAHSVVDTLVNTQFDAVTGFNARTNARGTLILIMEGVTAQSATRLYDVYFDTVGSGSFTPPPVPVQVAVTDTAVYQTQPSFKIVNQSGRYFFHKPGGGFASFIDPNGNDWISWQPGGGGAGEFRGIPNSGQAFHPGYTNSTSTLEISGPLRSRIVARSSDNLWESVWDIFPGYARMTMTRMNGNWWWLYEGTPGGQFQVNSDYLRLSTGQTYALWQRFSSDLPDGREWSFFGDPAMNRVLYVAMHEDNTYNDFYRTIDSNMTVWGFGRIDPCCTQLINRVPLTFTYGFSEDSTFAGASQVINSAYKDLLVSIDFPQTPGSSGGTPLSTIVSDNFNSPSLNSTLWTYFNPRGDAPLTMTGSALDILVPPGVSHDVWTSGNFAPRVMQPANNTNFEVEAKFTGLMNASTQIQGIIVQQDPQTYLRFDFVRQGGTKAFAAVFENGGATARIDTPIAVPNPVWLRVKRVGNVWTHSWSANGNTWNVSGSFSYSLHVSSVGPFFGNGGANPPAFRGTIDYFYNTETPIVPSKIAGGDHPGERLIPKEYFLNQNYPNPFNPATTIQYGIPENATVTLTVFNMLGQEIAMLTDGVQEAGYHSLVWQGLNGEGAMVGSGVYIYRIKATGVSGKVYTSLHKMILIR